MPDRSAPPMPFQFMPDGTFVPRGRFRGIAARYYQPGKTYALVEHEERSIASHRHYFAALTEAFAQLPERWASVLPTMEHLRKYALIKAGFFDAETHVCKSKAEAERAAALLRRIDDFSIVEVNGKTVARYTAKSQSTRAMGNKRFQESKSKVLEVVAAMAGVTVDELQANAGRSA